MASTTFTSGTTITAPWLNDVNTKTYADTSNTVAYTPAGTGAVATTVQAKLRESVSVKDFGAVGDGTTDDTAAIQAAVTYAYTNNVQLDFPSGTFLTTSSISNFHNVVKTGNGVVKRGTSLFYVGIQANQSHTLYVATTGSDTNDGLSASQPIKTPQKVFDTLKLYGPVLNGSWTIQLAAGTYNNSANLIGLRSVNDIVINGPSVGGHPNVPTALVDGTGVTSSTVGWYFQFYLKVAIYNIKFQNWTSVAGDAYGLNVDGHCQAYLDNCHFYNCRYAGISVDNLSQLRLKGGIIDNCLYSGVRLYSQVSASVGYSGLVAGDSTEIKNCGVGISGRVSSRLHVDYCYIHNCDTAIQVEYNTRGVINYTRVENNNIGWYATLTSDLQTSYDGSNTSVSNNKAYICYSSVLSSTTANECNYNHYWDEATKYWLYGATSYRTPNAKFEWQMGTTSSGSAYNSGVRSIFDGDQSVNYLALSGPANSYNGIFFTAPLKSSQGGIAYSLASDYCEFWTSAAAQYRMQSSQFVPLTDNNKTLGNSSYRWSTVYAGTGAINTSDIREKEQIKSLDDKEKAVAVKLKNLIKTFKFKTAVKEKGSDARIHAGIIAQDVKAAFESEGLVAEQYALFCYDEWDEQQEIKSEDGEIVQPHQDAGNRYGIRYDELLAFIISAL